MGTYTAKCDICRAENEVPNYGDWTCNQCGQRYDYDEGHRIRLSDAQLQALRARWIPVGERLPDDGVNVLVWRADRSRAVVAYRREKWWDGTDEELNFHSYTKTDDADAPTHWMPLPEPPEVKR